MTEHPGAADALPEGAAAPGAGMQAAAPEPIEPPPILGTWPRLYALVIAELIAVIALCGWLAGLGR